MNTEPHVGDDVEIPWGFKTTRGVLDSIVGPSSMRHGVVRVVILGSTGVQIDEELVTLPLSDIRVVTRSA